MYFISVLFSIPSGGARTKKNTQLCTQSENRFAFKIPSLVFLHGDSPPDSANRGEHSSAILCFLVTKRKMITKCGGMESGHLRSLRPSLRGTDVCTHMHESPTAEHANGGEPVMVLIQKLACSSALLLHPSPSAVTLFTPPLIHPSPSAVTLFTPPLIQSSIHPPSCTLAPLLRQRQRHAWPPSSVPHHMASPVHR